MIRMENKFYTPESEPAKTKAGNAEESHAAPKEEKGAKASSAEPNQMDLLLVMMQNMQEIQ